MENAVPTPAQHDPLAGEATNQGFGLLSTHVERLSESCRWPAKRRSKRVPTRICAQQAYGSYLKHEPAAPLQGAGHGPEQKITLLFKEGMGVVMIFRCHPELVEG